MTKKTVFSAPTLVLSNDALFLDDVVAKLVSNGFEATFEYKNRIITDEMASRYYLVVDPNTRKLHSVDMTGLDYIDAEDDVPSLYHVGLYNRIAKNLTEQDAKDALECLACDIPTMNYTGGVVIFGMFMAFDDVMFTVGANGFKINDYDEEVSYLNDSMMPRLILDIDAKKATVIECRINAEMIEF